MLSTCAGNTVTLSTTADEYDSYLWMLDDMTMLSGQSVDIILDEPGTHLIELIAETSLCIASTTLSVVVNANPDVPVITQNANVLTATGTGNFQWYNDGTEIADATEHELEITASGIYSVKTEIAGCMSMSDEAEYLYQSVDEMTNNTYSVMPNPAIGMMLLVSNGSVAAEQFQLTDAMGRVVLTGNVKTKRQAIDISGVAPGHYFLRVTNTSTGMQAMMKVVVE
ncbi:MAG: T9SS type A sorting domain-containing protein [Flavobacteriales bacterium]